MRWPAGEIAFIRARHEACKTAVSPSEFAYETPTEKLGMEARYSGAFAGKGRVPSEPLSAAAPAVVMNGVKAQEEIRGGRSSRSRLELVREPAGSGLRALDRLLGVSPAMQKVRARIQQFAASPLPLLILGETGTGKELVARAVHEISGTRIYVRVNSSGFARELIDSLLFGHEKGAFTGAVAARDGFIAAANGGILFLDEVTELSLEAQAKLLRVIELHEYMRVGSTEVRRSWFRVLAAANKDIDALARSGQFRDDFLYRLGKARILLPPLRERREDILLICRSVLQEWRQKNGSGPTDLSSDAVKLLCQLPWPGNVRELRAAVECAIVLAGHVKALRAEHFRECLDSGDTQNAPAFASKEEPILPMVEFTAIQQREYVKRVLAHTGGNREQAALLLEIDPSTLYRKLEIRDRSQRRKRRSAANDATRCERLPEREPVSPS